MSAEALVEKIIEQAMKMARPTRHPRSVSKPGNLGGRIRRARVLRAKLFSSRSAV